MLVQESNPGSPINHQSRVKKPPVGLDYVHSLVDDHSRLACSEILPDEQGATCAGFLARVAGYFADRGIARIERIMTDKACAYRWSVHEVVAGLGGKPPVSRLQPT